MEFEINIGTIVQALVGFVILIIGWFTKDKIKSIEGSITGLKNDFKEFNKSCSEKRTAIYNDVYKKEVVDLIKESAEERIKRLEAVKNGNK